MRLESTFRIPAPPAEVYDRFLDAETMRRSVPGCTRLDQPDATHFTGSLTNTIAHVTFNAEFQAEVTSAVRPVEIRAVLSGEDRRLASTLRVDVEVGFTDDAGECLVTYAMELAMWGKLGRMGESIFRRRTVEVERQFLEAFVLACRGDDAAAAAPVAAAGAGPLRRRGEVVDRVPLARAAPVVVSPAVIAHRGVDPGPGFAPTATPDASPSPATAHPRRPRPAAALAVVAPAVVAGAVAVAVTAAVLGRRRARRD